MEDRKAVLDGREGSWRTGRAALCTILIYPHKLRSPIKIDHSI